MHTQHGRDDDIQRRPQSGKVHGEDHSSQGHKKSPKNEKQPPEKKVKKITGVRSQKDKSKVLPLKVWWTLRYHQQKKGEAAWFDKHLIRPAENRHAWKSFFASLAGGLIAVHLYFLFLYPFIFAPLLGHVKAATKKTEAETVIVSPKNVSTPKVQKVQEPKEAQTEELAEEQAKPKAKPSVPPTEEAPVEVAKENVILNISTTKDILLLGLKAEKGPESVEMTLWNSDGQIAKTRSNKTGKFNFYFDAPIDIKKGTKLEVRCTVPGKATLTKFLLEEQKMLKEVEPTQTNDVYYPE